MVNVNLLCVYVNQLLTMIIAQDNKECKRGRRVYC